MQKIAALQKISPLTHFAILLQRIFLIMVRTYVSSRKCLDTQILAAQSVIRMLAKHTCSKHSKLATQGIKEIVFMGKEHLEEINIHIDALGSHGEGIGRHNGCAVFVPGALPNEFVKVKIKEQHKKYAKATLLEIMRPASTRIEPICPLFGKCGGCQLMHLEYQAQLEAKRQKVVDSLERIGGLKNIEVLPCLPSPNSLGYRNKIQVPVKQSEKEIVLGLYAHGSHDLIKVNRCYIHSPIGDEAYRQISKILKQSKVTAYDAETKKGDLRHLLIKSGVNSKQILVVFVTASDVKDLLVPIAKEIMAQCPLVKGVIQNINRKSGNAILGSRYELLAGSESIEENLGDLTFKVSAASFFQVNPAQATNLYAKALELAGLEGHETVLDAYCGVGTLSLFFAKHVSHVTGVECIQEAIVDAKENALANHIQNVSFICNDIEKYLTKCKIIDIALINPPRKGCSLNVLKELGRIAPKKIIYISCDPSTLARDLAILIKSGYQIKTVQPVDMFPQTAHVETVVFLKN